MAKDNSDAAAPLPVGPVWQPIETAPKDGTVVDLWMGADEFPRRVTDAKWCKPEHECISEYCDSCPSDIDKFAWRDAITGYEYSIGNPTHWMPEPIGPVVDPGGPTGQPRSGVSSNPTDTGE